ncbi:MAG: clpC [Clostridiales bacterium]|jgi:ATP-dependent Clp protease ATP-binding subunit ClpC|nr:clpC [Clostridiales bacterium]
MSEFTDRAKVAIDAAKEVAREVGHNYVGTEHLLAGLLREDTGLAAKILNTYNVTEEKVLQLIEKYITSNGVAVAEPEFFTPRVKSILSMSVLEAKKFNVKQAGTEHILIALLRESDCVAVKILVVLGISPQRIYIDMLNAMGVEPSAAKDFNNKKVKSQQAQPQTPTLDQFSRDLTALAKENHFDPVIGRNEEIQRVIQILSRRSKNNPCLIGEPGVGKTAIVEGLAQKIIEGNVPETIRDKRVVTLDLSSMVAGSKYRGEFEERIKKAIEEVIQAGNVLLFIDEIHTIIGAGGAEGAIDASNILKPSLARGEIQLIGATTLDEYRKYIEKNAALERRFQPVKVDEPSEEEAIKILQGLRAPYEEHHKVKITDEAISAAVKLSIRYISDRFLPDKAIDLIDEASSKKHLSIFTAPPELKHLEQRIEELEKEKENAIKLEEYERAGNIKKMQQEIKDELDSSKEKWNDDTTKTKLVVGEEEIADIIASWTGIPVKRLVEEETEKLIKLEDELHKRVVGQTEAVSAIAKAIRRGRVGIKDPKRPIGSFLFLGPTGVGKTELSKALSEAMFGDENSLIRIDMSEYMEKHSVSKLIGSPPGYVGFEEGGQLSEKIRRKPYSVILFDEIEKAHPDVFNILLQILDDGHITDSQGRKVNFKNTVVIMTSNVGARNILEPKKLGFASQVDVKKDYDTMKTGVMEEVKKLFKPELLNRIDEIIVFHTLSKDEIKEIVSIMIKGLAKRLKDNVGIEIEVSEEAKNHLADAGFDLKFGARPLRRAIQSKVEDKLAEKMLEGNIKAGDKAIINFIEGEISIDVK